MSDYRTRADELLLRLQAQQAGAERDLEWLDSFGQIAKLEQRYDPTSMARRSLPNRDVAQGNVMGATDVRLRRVGPETRIVDGMLVDAEEAQEYEASTAPVGVDEGAMATLARTLVPGLENDPDALEAAMAGVESWSEPFNAWSRLAGTGVENVAALAGVEGAEVTNPFVDGGIEGPLLSESLVDLGAPEWLAAASEFAVPDPTGANRALDVIPLLGMAVPFGAAFRRASRNLVTRFKQAEDDIVRAGMQSSTDALDVVFDALSKESPGQTPEETFMNALSGDIALGNGYTINRRGLTISIRSPELKNAKGQNLGEAEVYIAGSTVEPGDELYDEFRMKLNSTDGAEIPVLFVNSLEAPEGSQMGAVVGGMATDIADATKLPMLTHPSQIGHMSVPTYELRDLYNRIGFEPVSFYEGSISPAGNYVRFPMPIDNAARKARLERVRFQQPGRTKDVDKLNMSQRRAFWASLEGRDGPEDEINLEMLNGYNGLKEIYEGIMTMRNDGLDNIDIASQMFNAANGETYVELEDFESLVNVLTSGEFDYLRSQPSGSKKWDPYFLDEYKFYKPGENRQPDLLGS